MTVASNPPYDQYTATGGQTVFNYTFEIVENTDLLVYQTPQGDAPNDLLQLLTFNVDYTVTGVGAENGGTVVLNTGAALGDIITIKQNVPVQRDTAFTPGGVLRANDLNSEFDNQTLIQQLTRFNEQQRMLRYWDSAIVVPYVDTILPVLGANQIWAKNPNNDEIIPYDVPPGGGLAPDQGTYIVQTPNGSLPNAVALYAYGSGFMANTAAIGFTATRVLVPTLNQINISNSAGLLGNPIFSIAPNVVLPGTAGMGIPEGTTAQRVTPLVGIGMRFNTDLQQVEAYIGGVWVAIPSAAAGLFLPLAGGTMAGNIDMDSNIIFGLPLPTNNDDAANKQYVDNAVGGAAGGITGNMQWNNGGAFAGDPNFNTDGAGNVGITGSFEVDNILIDGNRISATTGLVELEDAQLFNALDANSNKIENLAICTVGTDAANKNYVDATAAGRYFVAPVRASATGNFAATYNNGASGVGATLTANVNGAAAQDGVTLTLNDRVVFPFQSSSFQNGIYTVTDLGSVGTPAVYTRATDYDQPTEIDPGDTVGVTEGTLYAGAFWMETAIVNTIGTDPITFILSVNPNVVTLDTSQTITGAKTFTSPFDVVASYCTYGNNRTDATNKVFTFRIPNYNNADGYFAALVAASSSASNSVYIGGETATANAATQVQIMCAANTTTPTGTTIADYNISGMRLGAANARVTTILNDATMVAAAATNLYTGAAIKDYIDGANSPTVKRVQIRVFTTSTSYTPTVGMLYCQIEVVGGGGAGGGCAAGFVGGAGAGGGGGSGGYSRAIFTAAQIGGSQAITIGAGGLGAVAGAGGSGSVTSVGTLISANGGAGGAASNIDTLNNGINGGIGASAASVSGGVAISGNAGYPSALYPPANVAFGGAGASSFFGGGTQSLRVVNAAFGGNIASANSGAGGSGSASANVAVSANAGGNGGSGRVVITEYLNS